MINECCVDQAYDNNRFRYPKAVYTVKRWAVSTNSAIIYYLRLGVVNDQREMLESRMLDYTILEYHKCYNTFNT